MTAFHPDNDNHELRIPEGAQPFDSGMLAAMESFQWTFDVEGTYDYFSKHHEGAGLIGRIGAVAADEAERQIVHLRRS